MKPLGDVKTVETVVAARDKVPGPPFTARVWKRQDGGHGERGGPSGRPETWEGRLGGPRRERMHPLDGHIMSHCVATGLLGAIGGNT